MASPNFQKQPVGLGSYLTGIIPQDSAIAAGAFSFAMQQIKNIKELEFEKFAQVAASLEMTTANLNLINGTDVPVDVDKSNQMATITQQGSGPYGTYTASDFFGSMSGLPYSWKEFKANLLQTQSTKLANIYDQLFLAVTWEAPTAVPTYTTYTIGPTTYYTITGVTFTNPGGGYGRGSAPKPVITFSNGGTANGVFGINANDAESMGNGTYGRLVGFSDLVPGTDGTTIPTVASIDYPPTSVLPVQANGSIATGGTNSAFGATGWPSPMNDVVEDYIDQANAEILYLSQSKKQAVATLNTLYNQFGAQLKIEQRSRFLAIPPVPLPDRSKYLSMYPMTITSFVDTVGSTYALSTRPHMYAQTLEAISDLSNITGQSLVGLMRQERNKARLDQLPVPLDNVIPNSNDDICCLLVSNGTTPTAKTDASIPVTGINGNVANPTTSYTTPALLVSNQPDNILVPEPKGFYDPNINKFITTTQTTNASPVGNILDVQRLNPSRNINLLGPYGNGIGPAIPIASSTVDIGSIQSGSSIQSRSPVITTQPIAVVTSGEKKPAGDAQILDDGSATFPGSLAGSPVSNLFPCELNTIYTSSVLLPSTLTTQQAIDDVITCNCDCWVS